MSDLTAGPSPNEDGPSPSEDEATGTTPEELAAQLEELERIVAAALSTKNHSEEELRARISAYRPIEAPSATDDDCDALARRLIDRLSIDVERGVAVVADDFEPWLAKKKPSMDRTRWLTYKQYLFNSKWAPAVIENLDVLTDQILDFAGDPTAPGSWARRGLVLGDVQSGKTASYLALFNKAADAGYRLIIVLAGHTEILRRQTQRRVDEGFIGRDTRRAGRRAGRSGVSVSRPFIGVGLINRQIANVQSMTTMLHDFKAQSQETSDITIDNSSPPYVFVVKKNVSKTKNGDPVGILPGLAQWLAGQPSTGGKIDVPVLLLDDESDYASVNTREEENRTAVNDAIRGILAKFSKSSYVAFTATPFANIFINDAVEDDLFPKDFIYSLESPSNYIGALETFGSTTEKNTTNVVELKDIESVIPLKHKSSFQVDHLPGSLIDAIRAFFITNAIRDLRGQKENARAMLVNVSRFKAVQRQVYALVEEEVSIIKNAIELYSVMHTRGERNQELVDLERIYRKYFPDCEYSWEQVLATLGTAVSDIRVQLYNSDTDRRFETDELMWQPPQRSITVGGDVLSRGLTLDGLSTSYFYRQVRASDTLLQMARWFGYRDGYHDLCRTWIDSSVAQDFRYIADAVDELRLDLRSMFELKLTPNDFGLAVRRHPGALLVTARNKMKHAEEREAIISVLGRRIETVKLPSDPAVLRSNYVALEDFIGQISDYRREDTFRGYHWWQGVPKAAVADFLDRFRAHSTAELFYDGILAKFVRTNMTFPTWDVVLVNGSKSAKGDKIASVPFIPPSRTFVTGGGQTGDPELRLGGKSARLAGADDLANLFGKESADAVRAAYSGKNISERIFYKHLERPALLVYALRAADDGAEASASGSDSDEDRAAEEAKEIIKETGKLIVALKLAFPGDSLSSSDGNVKYVINAVAQRTWFPEIKETFDENFSEDPEEVDA